MNGFLKNNFLFFAEYTVFILPYNGDVIGTPSNLKVVVTKEDGMFKTLTIISNSVAVCDDGGWSPVTTRILGWAFKPKPHQLELIQ